MTVATSWSVDVLLPVYAKTDHASLQRSILSVLGQTLPAQTLWVLINGATAIDRALLSDFVRSLLPSLPPTVVQVVCLETAGITAALNRGMMLSQADWLARLDADDCMRPQRLQTMVAHLQACHRAGRPLPDVLGSAVTVLDSSGRPTGRQLQRPCSDRAIRRYLCYGNPFLHPSVILRRSRLQQLGGYRPIPQAEDLDLWLRLARFADVRFANLREPLTLYSLSEGSLSHQRDSFLRSAICRLRHCDSPLRALLFAPKILVDLLRYLQHVMLQR